MITDKNKISELIPSGYKFVDYEVTKTQILINIEKMVNNNFTTFRNYIDEYFKPFVDDETEVNDIRNWVEDNYLIDLKNNIIDLEYYDVPFEFKIGLLKFICKDLGCSEIEFRYILYNIDEFPRNLLHEKINKICPPDFLKSIFTEKI